MSKRLNFWPSLLVVLAACQPASQTAEAPNASPDEPGWRRLFDGQTLQGWKITDFGGQGRVYVRDGSIVLNRGDDITGITWDGEFPSLDYEVELEAMRIQGHDFFCALTFPVADSFCSLIVGGWGDTVVGLSNVDGRDASENETTRRMGFENDRWYTLRLRVDGERIQAWIDGMPVVDLQIGGRSLSVRPEVSLSRPFGLASWRSIAAFRNIRVKE
jgi:hypothetical protein